MILARSGYVGNVMLICEQTEEFEVLSAVS